MNEPAHGAPSVNPAEGAGELERLQKLSEDYLAGWKRAKADYLNLRKETEREKAEFVKFANAALLMELLPMYGMLTRAAQQVPQELNGHEWVKGVLRLLSDMEKFFTILGIQKMRAVGEPFNPERHEAVSAEVREGTASGTILEELSPGFLLHDKVLLPSKVKVAQ